MITEALHDIVTESNTIIKVEAKKLFSNLIATSPVGDTGDFKKAWVIDTIKVKPIYIRISNSMEYADVLARGRRKLPNFKGTIQWYGSHQWYNGLAPMLLKTNAELNKRLKGVKA